MRSEKFWLIQDDFKVGDKVIYSINSKNLNDIFSHEKFNLKLLCKELSISLPTLKKYLNKPELFKEKQVDKLCELLNLSNKELKNYFNSNIGSKIRGFKGFKIGVEYTISGVSEDGTKVLIKEDFNNNSSNNKTTFYNYWRFEGVKIKVKHRNFLGVGLYTIKNEINEERKQFWIEKEKEEKRKKEIQQQNINKNIIPEDEFNIQKMYGWDGWFSFIKEFVLITGSLLFVSFLLYYFWNDFDPLYLNQKFSILQFLFCLLIVSFNIVVYPGGVYINLQNQLIIYKCINHLSKYKCVKTKHIGLVETKNTNIKYYRRNFQLTKNGFHKFISLKHGVDDKNNHFLDFSLISGLESSYYTSNSPSFEETVVIYLYYMEWGGDDVKFYID